MYITVENNQVIVNLDESAWPTANGYGHKILPRKEDCSGPSQASILSAGFSANDFGNYRSWGY